MLDAAVAGPVFTSPTPDMVYEGIKAVATDAGVLCIVKNYTGDVMNFEMAVDMAKDDDIKADYVVVNDDVAVEDSSFTTGRRGVAGTILVHKIAGARAEEGGTLEEVVKRHPLTGGLSELLAYFVLAEGQERGDAAAEEMHIPFEKGNRKRIAIMNEIRFPFERK